MKYHCSICKAIWFNRSEPKWTCHKTPAFACKSCIAYQLERSAWDWLHGKDFKQPRCGDCRTPRMDKHKAEAKLAESQENVRVATEFIRWIYKCVCSNLLNCGSAGHSPECTSVKAEKILARLDSWGKEKA